MPEALTYLQTTAREPGAIYWAAPEHFLVRDIGQSTNSDIYCLWNLNFLASAPFTPGCLPSSFPGIVGRFPTVGSTEG